MTRPDLSAKDIDGVMAEHAARTAMLRALHPINRPALHPTERDSEIRVAMGAVAIVFILVVAGLALGFASLVTRIAA